MITVIALNKRTGVRFERKFESPYLASKYITKVKKSTKVEYISDWSD